MISHQRGMTTYLRQCYEANQRRRDRRTAAVIVAITLVGATLMFWVVL